MIDRHGADTPGHDSLYDALGYDVVDRSFNLALTPR